MINSVEGDGFYDHLEGWISGCCFVFIHMMKMDGIGLGLRLMIDRMIVDVDGWVCKWSVDAASFKALPSVVNDQ